MAHIAKIQEYNFREIVLEMEELITKTEDYYQNVHQSIPVIERNMELTSEEMTILIRYFLDSKGANGQEGSLISDTLQDIKDNFQKIRNCLLDQNQIKELLNVLLNNDNSEISFENFLALIIAVEKKLRKVKQISLNSVIFSAKLGQRGVGFAVVSDFIHQTSVALEKELVGINAELELIGKWYQVFREVIEKIMVGQKKAVEEYITTLDLKFAQVVNFLDEVRKILASLMNNTNYVVTPFQELMVLIQRQDIVRQSIENTIKCLLEVEKKYDHYRLLEAKSDNRDQEQILDHVVFLERGMELVEKLAEKLGEQLYQSVDEIGQTITRMVKGLEEVREDGRLLAKFLSGATVPMGEGMVSSTFQDLFDFMDQFTALLKEISQLVTAATKEECSFKILEQNMGKVVNQVGTLSKIKVMAKIELARIGLAQDGLVDQINDVTEDVQGTVTNNHHAFIMLKDSIEKELKYFDNIILSNQKQIDLAIVEMDYSIDILGQTKELINQAILALDQEIENFHQQLVKIAGNILKTHDLKDATQHLLANINQLKKRLEQEKLNKFRTYSLSHWEEKDQEILELYKFLTGYVERFTAKNILSFTELDEGSQEGELVLF